MVISLPKSEQDKFRRWVKEQSAENQKKCKALMVDVTTEFHRNAMRQAPVNFGRMRASLHIVYSNDKLGSMVYANANYAPYKEFGTGKKVRIPSGYEAFAWQFKGQGIRKVNQDPKPFFISNYELAKKRMIKELNKMGFK